MFPVALTLVLCPPMMAAVPQEEREKKQAAAAEAEAKRVAEEAEAMKREIEAREAEARAFQEKKLAEAKSRGDAGTVDAVKAQLEAAKSVGSTMLWVDRHKPQDVSQLVGNSDVLQKLDSWLSSWERIHVHGGEKPKFNRQNPGAKAALLSGPPGIGKSTLARLIGEKHGYDIYEMNASDARSQKLLKVRMGMPMYVDVGGGSCEVHQSNVCVPHHMIHPSSLTVVDSAPWLYAEFCDGRDHHKRIVLRQGQQACTEAEAIDHHGRGERPCRMHAARSGRRGA